MKLEREVGVADLFWYVVSKWRFLILALLIGAILAAGYSYVRTGKVKTADNSEKSLTVSNVTVDDLDSTDIATLNQYFQYLDLVENQTEYVTTADFMKIDPYETCSSSASYYIRCQDAASLGGVLETYSGVCWDLNTEYGELFEFSIEKDSEGYSVSSEETAVANEAPDLSLSSNGIIRITMFAADYETAEANIGKVEKAFAEATANINKSVSPHELEKLGSYSAKVRSALLLNKQKMAVDTLNSLTTSLNNTKKLLSPQAALYAEKITSDPAVEDYGDVVISEADKTQGSKEETKTEAKQPSKSLKKRISKKLVLLGALALFVAAVLLLMIVYLLGRKLRPEDDLSKMYGVPSLGFIRDPDRKKKTALDRAIEARMLRRVRVLDGEGAEQLLAANIELQAKKSGAKTVYATGTLFGEKEKTLIERMSSLLEEKGIDLIAGEAVLDNAAALEKMGDSDCAVILERAAASDRLQLEKLISFCKESNITPIGASIVE